jgi:hypothetical protein
MSTSRARLKVYQTKGKTLVMRYRIIPYAELKEVLKKDDEAFLEDSDGVLKRGTIWKAARRLSELVGQPVRAEKACLRFEGKPDIPGYSFSLEKPLTRPKRSRGR